MKVLYVLANYPQASESYVDAEMIYAASCGVKIEIWSPVAGTGDAVPGIPIHRGKIEDTIKEFAPDLIHVHHLISVKTIVGRVPKGVPVTVRAHSFDWLSSLVQEALRCEDVVAIYTFPYNTSNQKHQKFVPLPVAYDPNLYRYSMTSERNLVVRTGAALPTKGLVDFLTVGNRIKEAQFVLSLCPATGDMQQSYITQLRKKNNQLGGRVRIDVGLPMKDVTKLIHDAGIYLHTSDPAGHPFGMPISIAEAMACGLPVVVRDCPAAREYIGGVGFLYQSVAEAEEIVRIILSAPAAHLSSIRQLAVQRASLFRTDVVLERLVTDWMRFCREKQQ